MRGTAVLLAALSVVISLTFVQPRDAEAGADLTLPVLSTVQVNSWFDHNLPGSGGNGNMTRYDGAMWTNGSAYLSNCTLTVNCYDGHNGVDFQSQSGSTIVAAASGVVQFVGWQDPNFPNVGFGFYVRVWHASLGYSTLYAHLQAVYAVSQGQSVSRGQLIGYSDSTGASTGPHLHFGVYNSQTGWLPMDPYGWSGAGNDPWSSNIGYLWTTNPPSNYEPWATIEGALVSFGGPEVYIISGGKKRWVTSSTVFNNCGYHWDEIMQLPSSASGLIPNGGNLSSGPPCPYTLVAVPGTSPVYLIFGNSTKRWVSTSTVFNGCKYVWGDIVSVTQTSLNSLYTGDPLNGPPCPYVRDPWYSAALLEGSLVASGNPVYVISGGVKRWIVSAQVRDACGYKTNDVINVSSTVLNLIPTGPNIIGPPCPYTLFKGSSSAIYVMESVYKRHVASPAVFDGCGYIGGEVVQLTNSQVNSVPSTTALTTLPCPFTRQ